MKKDNRLLFEAIKAGRINDVSALITQENINEQYRGGSALYYAIYCLRDSDPGKKINHIEIITFLIQNQAVLCSDIVNPAIYVQIIDKAQEKYPEVTRILGEAKIASKPETLFEFSRLGNTTFVERLLAKGVNPNSKYPGCGGTMLYDAVKELSEMKSADSKSCKYFATIWALIKAGASLTLPGESNENLEVKTFNKMIGLHQRFIDLPIKESTQLPDVIVSLISDYSIFSILTPTKDPSKTPLYNRLML
jgi:hypothetical protein